MEILITLFFGLIVVFIALIVMLSLNSLIKVVAIPEIATKADFFLALIIAVPTILLLVYGMGISIRGGI